MPCRLSSTSGSDDFRSSDASSLGLAAVNVNGWTTKPPQCSQQRRRLLVQMMREHHIDICVVQEHHLRVHAGLEAQRF